MTPLLSNQLLRTQSDGRLATLAATGHDRAFEAIVDRYRKPLARYLRRLLSEALAEDVLQATFVRAWQALGSGTEVRDLRPWLYRIAHNQAINALRAASAALPAAPEVVDATQALPAISTETQVEYREELRQTLHGIGTLPDRQRAALVAVAVDDRAHADVAAELGLSDGALRQLLLRARTTLRAAATAITPYPLVGWISAGQDASAARVAEVAAGAGGAGLAVKAGAAVLAASAVVAGGPVLRNDHAPARATASPTTSATTAAKATPATRLIDDHRNGGRGVTQAGADPARRSGRTAKHTTSAGRGSHDGSDHSGRSGSSGSGSDDSISSGHSGSGSSGSDTSEHSGSGDSNSSEDSGSGSSGSDTSKHGGSGHADASESSGSGSDASGSGSSGSGSGDGESRSSGDRVATRTPTEPTPPPVTGTGDDSGHGGDSSQSGSGDG